MGGTLFEYFKQRMQNANLKMQNDNVKLKNKKILDTKYKIQNTRRPLLFGIIQGSILKIFARNPRGSY